MYSRDIFSFALFETLKTIINSWTPAQLGAVETIQFETCDGQYFLCDTTKPLSAQRWSILAGLPNLDTICILEVVSLNRSLEAAGKRELAELMRVIRIERPKEKFASEHPDVAQVFS